MPSLSRKLVGRGLGKIGGWWLGSGEWWWLGQSRATADEPLETLCRGDAPEGVITEFMSATHKARVVDRLSLADASGFHAHAVLRMDTLMNHPA